MARLFILSSLMVLPFWILAIFLPHWSISRRILRSRWPVILPSVVYLVLLLPLLDDFAAFYQRPDLAILAGILSKPQGALVFWLHLLCLDMFVGRWAYLDSRDRAIPAWIASPILVLIMLFGPIGFLAHMGVRTLHEASQRKLDPHLLKPGIR